MREAVVNEENLRKAELGGAKVDWWFVFRRFVECEHMQKVNEILERVTWSELESEKSWQESLDVAFISLLNCLALGKNSESKEWLNRIIKYLQMINLDSLSFDPVRSPPEIHLISKYGDGSGIGGHQLVTTVEKLLNETNRKIRLMEGNTPVEIVQIKMKIELFHSYLLKFPSDLKVKEYFSNRRDNYPQEITDLKAEYDKYIAGAFEFEDRKKAIMGMIEKIETQELKKIFGGSIMTFKL